MEIENEDGVTFHDSGDFDCNICLDQVQDPVVTFCGHLFCWPCIYKWTCSSDNTRQRVDEYDNDKKKDPCQKCPVCKADVSHATLVPIYGRGRSSTTKTTTLSGLNIPERPSCPVYELGRAGQRLGEGESERYMNRMPNPVTGVVCEMVYRRLFGESSSSVRPYRNDIREGQISPRTRTRRRAMQADEYLSRVYSFLVCFMLMCLLLF